MPKETDLEGKQDMGGKHGGQAGMPKPEQKTLSAQGIVRDEQPADKPRSQHVSRKDEGRDDRPGDPQQSKQKNRARLPRGGAP